MKALILFALAVAVGAAIVAKNASREKADPQLSGRQARTNAVARESGEASDRQATASVESSDAATRPLPRLVDLGAGKCIPCKMMEPILEELKEQYQSRFDVVFIDVGENEKAKEQYDIRVIPTQIFLDAEGEELFRHEGFYSRQEILEKWQELGFRFAEEE